MALLNPLRQAGSDNDSQSNGDSPFVDRIWYVIDTIRRSATLSLATAGFLFVLVALVIRNGVWAALIGAWGIGMFVIGTTLYFSLWFLRR